MSIKKGIKANWSIQYNNNNNNNIVCFNLSLYILFILIHPPLEDNCT